MPRDLYAENNLDSSGQPLKSSVQSSSPNQSIASVNTDSGTIGMEALPSNQQAAPTPSKPPRDLYAENGIDPATTNSDSWIPSSPIRDLIGGVATAGQNIHNLLTPQSQNTNYDFNAPDALALGVKNPNVGDKFTQGVGQYAAAGELGDIGSAGRLLSGMDGAIPQVLGRAVSQAAPQAAYGFTQNPQDRLQGAAIAGGIGAAVPLWMDALNAARPSNFLRGSLSAAELQQNLDATQGTNTGLGRVIASPSINRLYENILPNIIGSGAEDAMQTTKNQISQSGNDLMDSIKGDLQPSDLGQQIQEGLKKAAAQARADKNASYGQVNDLADSSGLTVGRSNLQQVAKNTLNDIEQSPELKGEMDPSLYSSLQKYASNPEGNTLKLSNIFKGKLGDKANDYYSNGKMYEYGIANSLKQALGSDIENSIANSGSDELKGAYDSAQNNYAKNFAPFEDKDIVKFTRQGGDPDLILNHFLKTGANDRTQLLAKLVSKLPQSQEGNASTLPLFAYLSKAADHNGEVDPVQLSALYSKLGEGQKDVLISDPTMRKSLDNYSNLVSKNKEAFNLMFNPKTGARNTDPMLKLAQLYAGNTLGGLPGLAATAIGSAAGGRLATKLITSPSVRENLVKKMIQNKQWQAPQGVQGAIGTALNAIYNRGS